MKTFKELFANTGIEPTTDENGNIQYNFKATMKEEPKQETLEEAAEKEYPTIHEQYQYDAFIEGAKWQQEKSYSEEDMINAWNDGNNQYSGIGDAETYLEQFKKK